MTTHPKCGKSWSGLKLEHCAVCCETFTNRAAADTHRVGSFSEGTRRCLTPGEMAGRTKRPLGLTHRGYWTFADRLGSFTGFTQNDEEE
jgi:hypothetical protein